MRFEPVCLIPVALVLIIATLPSRAEPEAQSESPNGRSKRSAFHLVQDCIMVTSEEGQFFYKARTDEDQVCGVYFITDPDRLVEIHIDYLDVPCHNGRLVSFIDGWEMNRQFFPNLEDHPKPLSERFREFCGISKVKPLLVSSQNAAMLQYRISGKGRGFSFTVRYPKNRSPCNMLTEGTTDLYTLRNRGKQVNCSLTAVYPGNVKVLAMNVGLAYAGRNLDFLETGTKHKCETKRGLRDYVQIGGSSGLDTSQLEVAASICGMDSKPGSTTTTVFCGVTSVRLVSSGDFDNSVTVALRKAVLEEDIDKPSFFCQP